MRISRRRRGPKPQKIQQRRRYRINQQIRIEQVRLIDEHGENVGIVDTANALSMARDRGLDLVEVSPVAHPPVAKIVDFSKMLYEEEKERRKEKAKQKKIEVKGIRLSLRIGSHDMGVRLNSAKKFLEEGDKVKIELILRGRERRHADLAKENIQKFIDALNAITPIKIEQPTKAQGGKLSALISNA